MQIAFTKMHGLGNDFILVDGINQKVQINSAQIRHLADRHFGIGFDQMLLVEPPDVPEADFNYRIFNVDGTEVEHCGNGARCFAAFVREKGLSNNNPVSVKTTNRLLSIQSSPDGSITVNMGLPEFKPEKIPFSAVSECLTYQCQLTIAGEQQTLKFSALSMGNPHAVIIVEDLANTAVTEIGEAFGSHPDFPEGVNVGFMQIETPRNIQLRVFERGTGETLACGTGACSAVVTGQMLGLLESEVSVRLAGGILTVSREDMESPVMMSGTATTVYEGTIEL
ncbi:MAG: diaminopimelate epimerase [Gammaproteobacteria bacterium]|nr:diaminopimelate epimerase [Gammaproteobacteria bacterium]MCY4356426.1 diaminopimelate epimerase [Gammaproteobacteria bacterium]